MTSFSSRKTRDETSTSNIATMIRQMKPICAKVASRGVASPTACHLRVPKKPATPPMMRKTVKCLSDVEPLKREVSESRKRKPFLEVALTWGR
jgi:hypothetical protein